MKRSVPVLALLVASALAFAGLARGVKKDEIRAAHGQHALSDVACETCHAGAAESRAGSDDLLPKKEVCAGCHDVEAENECAMCHSHPDEPLSTPRQTSTAQKFPHAMHLARGMNCAECHGAAEGAEPQIPEKSLCRTCHETVSDGGDCAVCHAESEPLLPQTHVTGWTSFHAVEARVNSATCENCHTQKECQDCHAGDNVRPRVHPLSYRFGHALEARSGDLACASCHEDREFCSSCHAAERILPRDHSRADWLLPRTGGRHAEEGRFDLESCAGCHESGAESPVCADCHGGGAQ